MSDERRAMIGQRALKFLEKIIFADIPDNVAAPKTAIVMSDLSDQIDLDLLISSLQTMRGEMGPCDVSILNEPYGYETMNVLRVTQRENADA